MRRRTQGIGDCASAEIVPSADRAGLSIHPSRRLLAMHNLQGLTCLVGRQKSRNPWARTGALPGQRGGAALHAATPHHPWRLRPAALGAAYAGVDFRNIKPLRYSPSGNASRTG